MLRFRGLPVLLFVTALVAALFAAPLSAAAPRPKTGGLSGVVLGHAGAPAAGATVRVYALPGLQRGCADIAGAPDPTLFSVAATATTRSDGTFTLPIVTGYYRLGVTPASVAGDSFGYYVRSVQSDGSNVTGYLGFADDVTVATGGTSGLTVRLSTPTAISGHVADPNTGAALAGIEVRAVPESIGQMTPKYPSTLTGATGDYVLGGLPRYTPDPLPGTPANEAAMWGLVMVDPTAWHGIFIWWHTLIGDPNAGPQVPAVDASLGDTTRSVEHFPGLALGGRVIGKVVDAKRHAVPGIEVQPWTAFPWPPVLTDSKGQFAVPAGAALRFLDPAGRYRTAFYPGVQAEADAFVFPAVPGAETSITMTVLGDAARVAGDAWYAVGQPAAGVWVGNTVTRCDGSFDSGGFWPGATTIEFIPPIPDGNPTRTLYVTLTAGQTRDVGQVTMPSWIIGGEVVDETTGEPVAGARVDLMNPITWDDPHYLRYWADVGVATAGAVTDDNGSFRLWLPDEPAGWPYLVVRDTAQPARFADQVYNRWPLVSDPDAVLGDQVTDENPMDDQAAWFEVFVAEAGLTVQVLQPDDGPIQDANVTVFRDDGGGWQPLSGAGTDENGWARFGLPAGTYRIQVQAPWTDQAVFYDNAADLSSATDVPVSAGQYASVAVVYAPFGP